MRKARIPVLIPMLLAACVSLPLHAEVYKCMQDGKLIYSDRPCSANAQPLQTETLPLSSIPAPARNPRTDALIRQHDQAEMARLQRRHEEDQQWLAEHERHGQAGDDARSAHRHDVGIYGDERRRRPRQGRTSRRGRQPDAAAAQAHPNLPQGTAPPLPGSRY
jgi:hypothetical protein